MINIEQKEFYNKEEIKKLLNSNEQLVYADDGINEVVIRYKNIPDYVLDYDGKIELDFLKFYEYETSNPIIIFSENGNQEIRKNIAERIIDIQQGGKPKKYKVIDKNDLEEVRLELGYNKKI